MTGSSDVVLVRLIESDARIRHAVSLVFLDQGWALQAFRSYEAWRSAPPLDVPGCLVLGHSGDPGRAIGTPDRAKDVGGLPTVLLEAFDDRGVRDAGDALPIARMATASFIDELVRQVSETVVSRPVAAQLPSVARTPVARRGVPMTDRETEIHRLSDEGLSDKQIGRRLGISHRTVAVHRGNVANKLGGVEPGE